MQRKQGRPSSGRNYYKFRLTPWIKSELTKQAKIKGYQNTSDYLEELIKQQAGTYIDTLV